MQITLSLPAWATTELAALPDYMPTLEERMAAVIKFSRLNFEHETGGPFAAGVFEKKSGKLIVIGVNRVVPSNCSSAHAEIVTISLAQKIIGSFDLGAAGLPEHQLVVNARPCAMCYGSIPWSGVTELVVAGTGKDVEELTGFDEGPVHPDWIGELNKRGISVIENIMRDEACAVLHDFGASNALVYNGRLGQQT